MQRTREEVVVVYQTVEEVVDRNAAVVTAPTGAQAQGSAVIVGRLEVRGKRVVVQLSIVDATAAVEDNYSWNRGLCAENGSVGAAGAAVVACCGDCATEDAEVAC